MTAARVQEAIETWRSLACRNNINDLEAEVMDRCEVAILRAAIVDQHHAAAICEIILYNVGSGGRSDSSETKALANLRTWIAKSPTRAATELAAAAT